LPKKVREDAAFSAAHFHIAVQKSEGIRNLMASYNEVLLAHVQQTAACNAHPGLHFSIKSLIFRGFFKRPSGHFPVPMPGTASGFL
jgi:hypothetical protein